jgi:crotonobetaine/carnitine-CoA ligase
LNAVTEFSSIGELVAQKAASDPDFPALTFECEGADEVRTSRQLWDNGRRIAVRLAALGLAGGDRFGLLMQNHPEFVEAMIASSILGTVFVPLDPRAKGARLRYLLEDSACRGVICGDYALANLTEIAPSLDKLTWALVLGAAPGARPNGLRVVSMSDALAPAVPDLMAPRVGAAEPMQVMYTSGTTGDPKGIMINHARFVAVAHHGEQLFGFRSDDRPYTGLSLTHGNAQFVTLASSLKMGLPAVVSRKFTKSRLWEILRRYRCTTFTLLGGMATAIYSEPAKPDDGDNPVRFVVSAGMPAAIWKDFARRFDVEIVEFYAAVEGGFSINPAGVGPVGSCGRVAPGLIAKLVDDQGDEVPPGTQGEILFRMADGSPANVQYLNNPEASARKTAGGWLHSGDVVTMDADGWLFYAYRKGSGIRHNGEFVSAALVEKILAEHDDVDDVFVYGIPGASGAPGEKDIVAAIVPRGAVERRSLFCWARERLEPNSVPSFVQIVSEIPKTASEKPQERFLIEMLKSDPASVHELEGE